MITVAAQHGTSQADTVSSASSNLGRIYSALIGGSSPVPPQQLVLVQVSVLKQYQDMIQELEQRSANDRQMLAELLRGRDVNMPEAEAVPTQMNASATAMVNSLIATVPHASFYRDEVEEL
jgi:hypothetical protein